MLFVNYPKCSTCRKAKKWLDEHNIDYESRHIIENNPTSDELRKWRGVSDLPLKRFFNTSGMKYRELKLKDKLPDMSEDGQLDLLSTDGMLVKRPILVGEDIVLVGFKVKEWEEKLLQLQFFNLFYFKEDSQEFFELRKMGIIWVVF